MKKIFLTLIFLFILLLSSCSFLPTKPQENPSPTPETTAIPEKAGMANPASVNCVDKGGELTIKKDLDGNEYGVCIFDDNRQCEEWAMYRKECPEGGVKITGYNNQGQIECAIKGGDVDMENKMCTLPNELMCAIYQDGIQCPDVTSPKDYEE